MPYKFKVGDRVKVIAVHGDTAFDKAARAHVGHVGAVESTARGQVNPYIVAGLPDDESAFNANELEAAPGMTRKKRGKK
ncbi:MAG: hypothetical protein QGD90_00255 [Candidatus Hydrogenedentes bacterium]|nr:hypothetical protein [Candidatus Hydrogenedentota bacterium]